MKRKLEQVMILHVILKLHIIMIIIILKTIWVVTVPLQVWFDEINQLM